MEEKSSVLAEVCRVLSVSGSNAAAQILCREYPFHPSTAKSRNYGPCESIKIFVRDGFVDRYAGHRLIFPPVLRLLSLMMPDEFPYQLLWKTEVTHPAYYELSATIDHLVPVSRGGSNEESNLVTTSMIKNSAKGNCTLEELGWTVHPKGNIGEWDGLLSWFVDFTETHPDLCEKSWIKSWFRAAKSFSS